MVGILREGRMTTKCSRYWVSLGLLLVASVPKAEPVENSKDISPTKADTGLVVPDLETILAQMARVAIRNETHPSSYTVTREYDLFGQERDKARSRVVANITFLPPDSRNYSG